jgi:hypothetical protein
MRAAVMIALLLMGGKALAAGTEIVASEDKAVCAHFQVTRPAAPIKWERLDDSSDGRNYRAVFDFENTGKPQEVRRREDEMMAFEGTYFLVAPQGAVVPLDWFREQVDLSAGFKGPPPPMKMYWQDDMNVTADIVQFNKKFYVRTLPVRDTLNFVMIMEAKDGTLKQVCRYSRPALN